MQVRHWLLQVPSSKIYIHFGYDGRPFRDGRFV